MNLTGILKSIILVAASAVMWATPLTLIQLIGYGIALAGMFYYSLPPEGLGPSIQPLKAGLEKILASDSAFAASSPSEGRLLQSARSCYALTQYEPVPKQDDEERQATMHHVEPKDAVA